MVVKIREIKIQLNKKYMTANLSKLLQVKNDLTEKHNIT